MTIKNICPDSLQEMALHLDILRVLLNSLGAIDDAYSELSKATSNLVVLSCQLN